MKRAINIIILILLTIALLCVIPCSYWDSDRWIHSAIFYNAAFICISILCLFYFNKGNLKAVIQSVAITICAYIQLLIGYFLYQYGALTSLPLFLIPIIFGFLIVKYASNYQSLMVLSSNLIASNIWAQRISGYMYFSKISSDLETIGVSSIITIFGAIITLVISIICICNFDDTND